MFIYFFIFDALSDKMMSHNVLFPLIHIEKKKFEFSV